MTDETHRTKSRLSAVLIATFLTMALFAAVIPGSAQLGLPGEEDDSGASNDFQAAAANEFSYNLTSFEQRAPVDQGTWAVSPDGSSATQTDVGEYATFLIADSSQVGGPLYRDGVFKSHIEAPAPTAQNNIFGFAFGLDLPAGEGRMVDTYILDWKAAEQEHLGHTAPEGFTLYHIDGQLPAAGDADFDDQQFACFWAKNDTNCTSADIEILAQHTGVGTGWEHDADYDLSLRFDDGLIRLFVDGGTNYAGGETVLAATGTYEPGEFGLFNFRQEDVTYSNVRFVDEYAPTFSFSVWCQAGDFGNDGWCLSDIRFRVTDALDHGSGIASVECDVDGESFTPCEDIIRVYSEDGEPTVTATVTDVAGNVATESVDMKLESEAPTVVSDADCFGLAYPTDEWCKTHVVLGVQSEPTSGVANETCALRADHLGETEFEEVTCGTFNKDGEWTLRANVTTNAGQEDSGEFFFKMDTTAPEVEILSPASGTSYMNGEPSPLGCILVAGTQSPCFASGSLDAVVNAAAPESNNYTSGFNRTEIWDGMKNGDNPANVCHIDTFTAEDGENGFFNFTWHTTNDPCPAEPHQLVTRVLEVRVWDNAGNFAKEQFEIFVIPPFP